MGRNAKMYTNHPLKKECKTKWSDAAGSVVLLGSFPLLIFAPGVGVGGSGGVGVGGSFSYGEAGPKIHPSPIQNPQGIDKSWLYQSIAPSQGFTMPRPELQSNSLGRKIGGGRL